MSNRPSTLRGILIASASGAFLVASLLLGVAVSGAQTPQPTSGSLLAQGLKGTIGSTIGPDGALYVPEGAIGKISRIDPATGATTVFASGLPPAPDFGGAFDIAFVGNTAYALVSVVEPAAASGIYRMDSPTSFTLVANLGAYSLAHPPPYPLEVPTGVQYALQPISGGFLVSDGHHNRILKVTMAGEISELVVFGNVVPTGLAVVGTKVYVSQVGPIPYAPSTGKVVSFEIGSPTPVDVASGFSAMVDVEIGPGGLVYALSQGDSPGIVEPGSPAKPNSGKLLRLNASGTFSVVADRLNLPTSLDFIGDSAFIVTLNGEVWKLNGVSQLQQIPATATPTATRTSTPTSVPPTPVATSAPATPPAAAPGPPNTGSGAAVGGEISELWLFLGGALVLIAFGSGVRLIRGARAR